MKKKKSELDRVLIYKRAFETKDGKWVLYDMMKVAHLLHSSYVKGDSHETAFREGERNMVLRILTILNVDPERLRELMKEGEDNE